MWPLHKFVTIIQPTAEALIEAITDRGITLLAIPETGARCRGEVVLSTWNTYLETVRCVVTYSALTGRARDADISLVGNRVVESYVEQAIFSTPGIDAGLQARLRRLRRNLDRTEKQPVEQYRTLPNPAAARALLGVTMVLPPGHQELTRRATPTTIMPVEVPIQASDAFAPPFDGAAAAAMIVTEPAPSGVYPDGLLRTGFDAIQRRLGGTFGEFEGWEWISDFGDPDGRAPRRARSGRRVGRVAAAQVVLQGQGRAAPRPTTSSPATWPRSPSGSAGTARSATATARCSATAWSTAARTTRACSS